MFRRIYTAYSDANKWYKKDDIGGQIHAAASDAKNGYKKVKELIEEHGVNVNEEHHLDQHLPIRNAVEHGSVATVKYMVEKGALLTTKPKKELIEEHDSVATVKYEDNLLYYAIFNSPAVCSYVAEQFARFNDKTTALHAQIASSPERVSKKLTAQLAALTKKELEDDQGKSLYWATLAGNAALVEMMLMLHKQLSVAVNLSLFRKALTERLNKIPLDNTEELSKLAYFYTLIPNRSRDDIEAMIGIYEKLAKYYENERNFPKLSQAISCSITFMYEIDKLDKGVKAAQDKRNHVDRTGLSASELYKLLLLNSTKSAVAGAAAEVNSKDLPNETLNPLKSRIVKSLSRLAKVYSMKEEYSEEIITLKEALKLCGDGNKNNNDDDDVNGEVNILVDGFQKRIKIAETNLLNVKKQANGNGDATGHPNGVKESQKKRKTVIPSELYRFYLLNNSKTTAAGTSAIESRPRRNSI